LPNTW